MLTEIAHKFNNDKTSLKKFSREMTGYNAELEEVIKITINAIATKFMGKNIDWRFAKHVNAILAEKYGLTENGNPYVSIEVENASYDTDKVINFNIDLPVYLYRWNIKYILMSYNRFYRNQCRQEATFDNKFNEDSIKSLVEVINVNRQRVATYQDAAENFTKYLKAVEKLEKEVVEKLGNINPMFYATKMDTNTYNTPNAKAFEEKMKEKGGTYVYDPQEIIA